MKTADLFEKASTKGWEADVAARIKETVSLFDFKLGDYKTLPKDGDRYRYYGTIWNTGGEKHVLKDPEVRFKMLHRALAKLLLELVAEGREVAIMRVTRYSYYEDAPDRLAPIFVRDTDTIARLSEFLANTFYWKQLDYRPEKKQARFRLEIGPKPEVKPPEPEKPKVLRVVKKSAT